MKTTVYKTKKVKDWFRLKRYPHVGMQLEPKDRKWVEPYVKDKNAIATHAFFPFVHRQLKVRKFRKEICHDGTRSKLRKPATKEREIYFSNHLDSNVFGYYSELLSTAYEKVIYDLKISNCVTAYRKVKLESEKRKSRNKCNIDFANDVFKFIKSNAGKDLVAVTFDIRSFFDNLDHKLLKKNWKRVINSELSLPPDHYNVYRNITKFSYIEEDDLFSQFKNQIIVERKPKNLRKIEIKKKNYLRNKRAVAYCFKENISDIRSLKLIKSNKYYDKNKKELRGRGVPQGSPISAVLANIYMIDFDQRANDFLLKLGGIYQRYSDDMLAICSVGNEEEVVNHFLSSIKDYKLEIQDSKTQVFHFLFNPEANRHYCFEKNRNTNKLQNNTLFEYLGFQFDGFYALIRNSSISNYYRKMKRAFARSQFYTLHNKTATKGHVFKNRLYKKFTHVGASRRRIYQRHPSKTNEFILSHKYDWGNFITYANLAEKIIANNKIGRQIAQHWAKFHELMNNIKRK